jgi:hypothetical protein
MSTVERDSLEEEEDTVIVSVFVAELLVLLSQSFSWLLNWSLSL